MSRVPIYFDGEIPMYEVRAMVEAAGLHLSTDGAHRLVVDQVPAIVRKDEPVSNVVQLKAPRARKGGRK